MNNVAGLERSFSHHHVHGKTRICSKNGEKRQCIPSSRHRLGHRTPSIVTSSTGSNFTEATPAQTLVERTFENNWRSSLEGHDHPDPRCRPIIALGKFDALHKGHQALAAAALKLGGSPVLLSFSGMGAVLGWQPRKPLVAPCDRPRILDLWAQQLSAKQQQQQQQPGAAAISNSSSSSSSSSSSGGYPESGSGAVSAGSSDGNSTQQQQQQQQQVPIRQHYIPFAAIRSMSPEAFVELLVKELKAAGVVAGVNYRFGYRAAGDSSLLQQLCHAAGLPVAVVELVGAAEPGAVGVVSSSKIREMLSVSRIDAVRKSLGRSYRLVAALNLGSLQQQLQLQQQHVDASSSSSSNISDGTPLQQLVGQQVPAVRQQIAAAAAAVASPQQQGHVYVQQADFLNQHPSPGVYLCHVQLYLGATAHDDLLQLQRAADAAASRNGNSSGSTKHSADDGGWGKEKEHQNTAGVAAGLAAGESIEVLEGVQAAGSGCFGVVRAWQQEITFVDGGLLVPVELLEAAKIMAGSSSSSNSSSSSSNNVGSRPSSSTELNTNSMGRRQFGVQGSGADPLCWDTDDNEDTSIDAEGLSALLVLDLERCLRQMCSVDRGSQAQLPQSKL